MLREDSRPMAVACACCRSQALPGLIWGVALCEACQADWRVDPKFGDSAVIAAVGTDLRAKCAEWTRRTHAWAAERRARRAA